MTLRDFVTTLTETGYFGTNKAKMVIDLFSAAGSVGRISDSAAKSWLRPKDKGGRSCPSATYFPENSVNDKEVLKFFRRYSNGAWKKLQTAFQQFKEKSSYDPDFLVDLSTEYSDRFYWSLLNQFQRVLHLPESEIDTETAPTSEINDNLTSKCVHDYFLQFVRHFRIMEIINRTPSVLTREDSASINVFLSRAETLIADKNALDFTLYAAIKHFIEALQIQALSLDACLNNRFGWDDDNASVNMEDDEVSEYENPNKHNILTLENTPELLKAADEPIHLGGSLVRGWEDFRQIMNFSFNEICSWSEPK